MDDKFSYKKKYSQFFQIIEEESDHNNEEKMKDQDDNLNHTLNYEESKINQSFNDPKEQSNSASELNKDINSSLTFLYSKEHVDMALSILSIKYGLNPSDFDPRLTKIMIENVITLKWYEDNITTLVALSRAVFVSTFLETDAHFLYDSEPNEEYKNTIESLNLVLCDGDIFTDHLEEIHNCRCFHEADHKRRKVNYDQVTNLMNYYPFINKDSTNLSFAQNDFEVKFHPIFYKTIQCKYYKDCPTKTAIPLGLGCEISNSEEEWGSSGLDNPTKKDKCKHAHMPCEVCPYVHEGECIRSNIKYSFRMVDTPFLRNYSSLFEINKSFE